MSGKRDRLRAATERLIDSQREALEVANGALDAEGPDGDERSGTNDLLEDALVDVRDILEGALEDTQSILEGEE